MPSIVELSTATSFLQLLHQYGSTALFGLLALGIIGLPVPDETLLLLAGTLVKSKQLFLISAWLAITGGTIVGISVSYIIGRSAGHFIIFHAGRKFGLNEQYFAYTQKLFYRFGPWLLFFGYFILGVRHFTGLIAGTIVLPYKRFALFAYTGAIIWSNLFFWLGYLYGLQTYHLFVSLCERIGVWIIIPIILIITAFIMLKKRYKRS